MPDDGDWLDIRLPSFLVGLEGAPGNELILRIEEATGSGPPTLLDALPEDVRSDAGFLIEGSTAIVPGPGDRLVEVRFDWPLAYCVLDESFVVSTGEPAPPPSAVQPATQPMLLDHAKRMTWADDGHPGPLAEYRIVTLSHVVQVVTHVPPRFRVLQVHG